MMNHTSFKTLDSAINDGIINLKLDHVPEYDIEDYDLLDDKDKVKYIKDLERIVRSSFEYRQYINYLRDNMDMNKCAIMENVSNKETFSIKIEIHHCPFTLYDICATVLNRHIVENLPTNIELVALEVIALHYYCAVGLIPLSKTVHELVHNGYIFIPIQNVFGNYQMFIDIYKDYMAPELLESYYNNLKYSIEEGKKDYINILKEVPTFIDASNVYKLPSYNDMIGTMYNRIDQIKQLEGPTNEELEPASNKTIIPGLIPMYEKIKH